MRWFTQLPAVRAGTDQAAPRWWAWSGLAAGAVALSLRTYHLGTTAQNLYYAAGVRSMLDSWHNLFFVSFDPSGSLMLDKPPLGFWLQAGAAKLLGFHYWVLAMPQVVAGVLAVALIFRVARAQFGGRVATIAAFALAVLPASVASSRNNSLDTITMLLMLIGAWFLWKATERGRLRWLLLAALCAGLAFNTKMFAAYVPLPAFAIAYGCSRRSHFPQDWRKLLLAGLVLLIVSLSWTGAVGLTPATERPAVYNGYGNNIWSLTLGYNGLFRVTGAPSQRRIRGTEPNPVVHELAAASHSPFPSPWRLFAGRLGSQIGWFLPAALLGAIVMLRSSPDTATRLLWPVWLLTGVLLFSIAASARPQYLEAMAAPTVICAAVGVDALIGFASHRRCVAAVTLIFMALPGLATLTTTEDARLAAVSVGIAGAVAMAALVVGQLAQARALGQLAFGASAVVALFIGPAYWSSATVAEPAVGSAGWYPVAGPDDIREYPPAPGGDFPSVSGEIADPVLRYLSDQTEGVDYLVLTERSLFGNAARYILQTNRAVLTLDSFASETDAAAGLETLVNGGRLRFIELPAAGPWSDQRTPLGAWFSSSCGDVTAPSLQPVGGYHLFECHPI